MKILRGGRWKRLKGGLKMLKLITAKELAKEIPLGEHKIRHLAKTYKDFPQIKSGNRRFFFLDEVVDWLKNNRDLVS